MYIGIKKNIKDFSPTNLNKFILKLNPVLTLLSGIMSNQNTGCSGSEILTVNKYKILFLLNGDV